jgi:4-carboxymuconolactone decarboxylase
MDEDLFDVGLEARKRVLGDEYVERAFANADSFNLEFQKLVTEYCWGEVWGRPTLTDAQRSLNNLCLLAALNRPEEFKTHFRGALRNGCTLDELRDTLIQITIYAGIPAGVEAFRLGRQVLDAEGITPEPASWSLQSSASSVSATWATRWRRASSRRGSSCSRSTPPAPRSASLPGRGPRATSGMSRPEPTRSS